MKINELRVGNLVEISTSGGKSYGEIVEVRKYGPTKAKLLGYNPKIFELVFCNPIPLTKEFFEKNGFINQAPRKEFLYYRSEDMRMQVYENYLGWVVNIDDEKFTMVFSNNLKYVHELQNAYYVSTGEEMKIRL